ncbi:MAG: Co2+/Mg2+ efflux protein ApaG [Sandaracinaceae bacterium]|nr:Co2+/Mg2+ efflux protein ApaG [Sandaracinaceae bacterium]MDW8247375.1 Co2+/Mg2+ efflux protein ApaG [Sandaracinaceae bacterium]
MSALMRWPATVSVALTEGIRVSAASRYLPEHSSPRERRYTWAYTIRIANESNQAARLISRHWIITDANERVEEVKGQGVVGEQPRIEPGEFFEYTSACVLETPRGVMRGRYHMVRDDGTPFEVEIAPFALEIPINLN